MKKRSSNINLYESTTIITKEFHVVKKASLYKPPLANTSYTFTMFSYHFTASQNATYTIEVGKKTNLEKKIVDGKKV